ncbi:MAG: YdcF family protein [bacterium]|nr:YdcF family protein [bacterium]
MNSSIQDKTTATDSDSAGKEFGHPRRSFLRRIWLLAQWMVNLVFAGCLILVFTPAGDWLGDALIDVDSLTKADYIVVLGGDDERAIEAANLYRQGWAPKVIVSSLEHDASRLADLIKNYGVPVDDILVDGAGGRTATHPKTVAQLSGVDKKTDRFIILTSPYHTSRSRACFERGGYEHICMQSPAWRRGGRYRHRGTGWGHRATTLSPKLYEVLAWTMYRVRGWL